MICTHQAQNKFEKLRFHKFRNYLHKMYINSINKYDNFYFLDQYLCHLIEVHLCTLIMLRFKWKTHNENFKILKKFYKN